MVVKTRLVDQYRKHHTQMEKKEKYRCARMVRLALDDKGICLSHHAKAKELYIPITKVIETITSKGFLYKVLEYNECKNHGNWEQRVLFEIPEILYYKDKYGKQRYGYLKVVYNVTNGEIVTAYYNSLDDNHSTLNLDYYHSSMYVRDYRPTGYDNKNFSIKVVE